jgi:hypothetical protein
MARVAWLFLLCLGSALLGRREARGAPDPGVQERKALFVLIVGVNRSVDADQEPLRFADDDAARYLDLFRTLGARAYLLARLDDGTRRLHPQAAAEASLPDGSAFEQAVAALERDVGQAARRGTKTAFFFVYAGHGRLRDNAGYLTLEDRRLTERDLTTLVQRVGASEAHVIVDACHADFLAQGRGAGGERRPAPGYSALSELARDPRVGLFLASSSTGEAHEWEGFQAGVFSHEVRSGLHGAADADADGFVSYRELTAFVERANAPIVNDRYRPRVLVRAPEATPHLVDLRGARGRRLELDGTEASAHHFLEDELGVRLLDFHNARGQRLALVMPGPQGRLYLHRPSDGSEFVIASTEAVTKLGRLTPTPSTSASRGAAHRAFTSLFALPFGQDQVDATDLRQDPALSTAVTPAGTASRGLPTSRRLAWAAGAVALGGIAAGGALVWSAHALKREVDPGSRQRDVAAVNDRIASRQRWAAAAGAAGVAAAWLFLRPGAPEGSGPSVAISGDGAALGWRRGF